MVVLAVAALLLGIVCGASGLNGGIVSAVAARTDLILYVLMFSVGISIGLQQGVFAKIRQYHVKILIIPFGIIAASLAGGLLCGALTGYPLHLSTAIASGLGWYSLSGVTISNLAGAEPGSIAFLSNLMREIFSFFLIPFLARRFNKYTCIAPAAATSEDTTLPMMMKYTDEETVVLSVFNGMICSAFVPVLIPLCFNL